MIWAIWNLGLDEGKRIGYKQRRGMWVYTSHRLDSESDTYVVLCSTGGGRTKLFLVAGS